MNPGPPKLAELESLLSDAISTTQFIIIDAFDECTLEERRLLLKPLQRIITSSNQEIKLFLSGRDGYGWRKKSAFRTVRYASTNSSESDSDLRLLVKKKLCELVEEEHLIVGDREILHDIEDHLLSKAQGM